MNQPASSVAGGKKLRSCTKWSTLIQKGVGTRMFFESEKLVGFAQLLSFRRMAGVLQAWDLTGAGQGVSLWTYWRCGLWESWNSNTLATWCEELTHLKTPWFWERLKAGGEGDNRGWDGWMASLTQWTWVWVNSRSWWWTGRLGVLQSIGSQRVGHNWATEPKLIFHIYKLFIFLSFQ